jgi:phage tail protein X
MTGGPVLQPNIHVLERKDEMSKVAVVYWSATGNTEAMADAVVEANQGLMSADEVPAEGYVAYPDEEAQA